MAARDDCPYLAARGQRFPQDTRCPAIRRENGQEFAYHAKWPESMGMHRKQAKPSVTGHRTAQVDETAARGVTSADHMPHVFT